MTLDFDSSEREQEQLTWDVLGEFVVDLEQSPPPAINLTALFSPLSSQIMAMLFLRFHRSNGTGVFFSPEKLFDIASEKMKRGRIKRENDIDASSGIYLFVRLVNKSVVKIGESNNVRRRIGNAHLRYDDERTLSKLIGHCKSRGEKWPQCIEDQEITALIFPMANSSKEERRLIENGLSTILAPETT